MGIIRSTLIMTALGFASVWCGMKFGLSTSESLGWLVFFGIAALGCLIYYVNSFRPPYRIKAVQLYDNSTVYFIQKRFIFDWEYLDYYQKYGTINSVFSEDLKKKSKRGEAGMNSTAAIYFTELEDAKTACRALIKDAIDSNKYKAKIGSSKNIYI